MKQYILLALALLATNTTKAQIACRDYEEPKPCSIERLREQANATPFIFEGECLDVKVYNGDNNGKPLPLSEPVNQIYFSQLIRIDKVFKGEKELKKGTIEIVEKVNHITIEHSNELGYSHSTWEISDDTPVPSKNKKGVYFYDYNMYLYHRSYSTVNSINLSPHYRYYQNCMASIEYIQCSLNNDCGAFSMIESFNTINDVYHYLYCNLEIKGAKQYLKKKENEKQEKTIVDTPYSESLHQKQLINYSNWETSFNIIHNNKSISQVALNANLNVLLKNPTITGTSTVRYFEFDIVANSDVPTYFDNALFQIQYNASAFGSNNAAINGAVSITKGAGFNTMYYINPETNMNNPSTNELKFAFGADYALPNMNRVLINQTPKILVHVKFKLLSNACLQPTNLLFNNTSFTSLFSYFTQNATDPANIGESYNQTFYGLGINDVLCKPTVKDFTHNIPAGREQTFTIKGKYFGATRANGNIFFSNVDAPQSLIKRGLNAFDYLPASWSDTLIRIKLPSIVDSVPVPLLPSTQNRIGSGRFKLQNAFGDTTSVDGLIIPYSYNMNILKPTNGYTYSKKRFYLYDNNGQGGYTLVLNTSTVPDGLDKNMVIAIIKKAMRDWACLTQANIKLDTSSTFNSATATKGLIKFGGVNNSIMNTSFNLIAKCEPIGSDSTYYAQTATISILNGFPAGGWHLDTLGATLPYLYRDFYGAITHEIGHVLNLLHVAQTNDIMYIFTAQGGTSFTTQNTVAASNEQITGLSELVTTSILRANNDNCSNLNPMVLYNCSTNGIEEVNINLANIAVFPNPLTNSLTINYTLDVNTTVATSITNTLGQVVYSASKEEQMGEVTNLINTETLASGVYFLNIKLNNTTLKTYKLIKL